MELCFLLQGESYSYLDGHANTCRQLENAHQFSAF